MCMRCPMLLLSILLIHSAFTYSFFIRKFLHLVFICFSFQFC
uniref:Uncharacterized protein n=1 Tax=Ascaris lumbricoides TaxID=6252 RepID=A0A0M3IT49_ASCLU